MLYQAELRSLPKARKSYGKSLEMQAPIFRGIRAGDGLLEKLFLWHESKGHSRQYTKKRRDVVPSDSLVQIHDGEDTENRECNHFLHDLQLRGRVDIAAPAVRRHL